MTGPTGFYKENGKTKPVHARKGITEDQFKKDLANQDDTALGRIRVMKQKMEKERETAKFIHREPVVGYIKNYSYGPRKQAVTLKVELRKIEGDKIGIDGKTYHNPEELSISGSIWNSIHSDIVSGGQNYDTLIEAMQKHDLQTTGKISNQDLKKLLVIWERWHLNGMTAGTEDQEKVIREYYQQHRHEGHSYEKAFEIVKQHGLETDKGYTYGHAWLYEPLPDDVVKFVREIQEKLNVKENGKPKE